MIVVVTRGQYRDTYIGVTSITQQDPIYPDQITLRKGPEGPPGKVGWHRVFHPSSVAIEIMPDEEEV